MRNKPLQKYWNWMILVSSNVFIELLAHMKNVPKDPNVLRSSFLMSCAEKMEREMNTDMPALPYGSRMKHLLEEIHRSGGSCCLR